MVEQTAIHMDLKIANQLLYPDDTTFFAEVIPFCSFRFKIHSLQPLWVNMITTMGMNATEVLNRFFALVEISEELPPELIDYSKTLEVVASQVGLMSLLGSPKSPVANGLDHLAELPSLGLRRRGIQVPTCVTNYFSGPPTN